MTDRPISGASNPTGFILDTPSQIELYRLFSLKHALNIEIRTGLKHSKQGSSVLSLVNQTLLRNKFIERPIHRKQAALSILDSYIETKTKALTDDPA